VCVCGVACSVPGACELSLRSGYEKTTAPWWGGPRNSGTEFHVETYVKALIYLFHLAYSISVIVNI